MGPLTPPLSPTQASLGYWLLPCLPGGPMGVWGPGHWGKRGLSTPLARVLPARSHMHWGGVAWGGVGLAGSREAHAALSNKKSLMLELRVSSLSTRILLGRTARALSRAGSHWPIATSSAHP